MAQVLLKVRQAEHQLEQLGALQQSVPAAVERQRLQGNIGVRQQPIEDVPVQRPALLAELERLAQAGKRLFNEVVRTEHFTAQGCGYVLAAPNHPAGTSWGRLHRALPSRFENASDGVQALCQSLQSAPQCKGRS